MAVSMGDVARHAGVSQRTVSNVVNNYVHVSSTTRAKVEASLAELGYRPNAAARQLRSGRTGSITLAIPGLQERYFADLADAVIRHAAESDIRVLVETTDGDHDTELALIGGSGGGLLTDGLIMSAVSVGPKDYRAPIAQYPIVLVGDRETEGWVDHVGIPNRAAARAAVEHLLALGRRRIALVGADKGLAGHSSLLRQHGYTDALDAAGIAVDPDLIIPAGWTYAGGEEAVEELINSGTPLPDAIFGLNDTLALGAMRALTRRGIDIPGQVAVIGFDDIAEARYSTPSLSSTSPSLEQIAAIALELISDRLDHGETDRSPRQRHVDFEVMARESTVG